MKGPDLVRVPWIRLGLVSRWPQLVLRAAALAILVVVIVAGLAGTPVGNRNAGIVLVWIAWWAALALALVPLLGRTWCSICPIPLPGEWIQHGAVLGPAEDHRDRGLGRRWPRRLRSLWIQNAGFLLLAVLSVRILTDPYLSAVVLTGFVVFATATAVVYERRAFCRYLCPVGGFIGLYSRLAPLELRVRSRDACACHRPKTCYVGGEGGYGCPWGVFPGSLDDNAPCGLCLECLRSCPKDNIAVRLRSPVARPLGGGRARLDEAFKALTLLGAAIAYSAVMLGPWAGLRRTAYAVGSAGWWIYAVVLLAVLLAGLPGGLMAVTRLAEGPIGRAALRRRFVDNASAMLPLGLAAWLAFTLSFAFSSASYVWPVLSDPLGRGQDLLGTAHIKWAPYLSGAIPLAVTLVLLAGLAWTCAIARRQSRSPDVVRYPAGEPRSPLEALRRAAPVASLSLALTVGMLWLLVG